MLETIARRPAADAVLVERRPAVFETTNGEPHLGEAEVRVTRASITIAFTPRQAMTVAAAAYGEGNGSITAVDGAWRAASVNHAGPGAGGVELFGTQTLRTVGAPPTHVAATRVVIAGDAWSGAGRIEGCAAVVEALSGPVASHHDRRLAIAVDDALSDASVEHLRRACSFVAGIDVEVLRVEELGADGCVLAVEHRRGFRRVGRGTHSPFTGLPHADRMRAWSALVDAFPRLLDAGVPIDFIVDQIAAHNQVAQIHVSAQLLLLATVTAAHHALHGREVGPPAASRRAELERLDAELALGLSAEDVARFEALRIEMLEAGFFHAPGYETGRPQRDIKFLRDIAHVVVLRWCGYTGPFYGAERFVVRELAAGAR